MERCTEKEMVHSLFSPYLYIEKENTRTAEKKAQMFTSNVKRGEVGRGKVSAVSLSSSPFMFLFHLAHCCPQCTHTASTSVTAHLAQKSGTQSKLN